MVEDTSEAKQGVNPLEVERKKMSFGKVFLALLGLVLLIGGIIVAIDHLYGEEEMPSTFEYNGYYFVSEDNGLWSVSLAKDGQGNDFYLVLHNVPQKLEDIPIKGNVFSFFPSNKTYLSYETETWERSSSVKSALADLSIKLAGSAAVLQPGVLFNPEIVCQKNDSETCEIVGVKTCETSEEGVIEFIESDEERIVADGRCIRIYSDKDDFVRVTDRLVYRWFGVMEQ